VPSSFRTLSNEDIDVETQGICQNCKVTQLEPIFMLQLLVTDQSLKEAANRALKFPDNVSLPNQARSNADEFARVLLYSNQALCNKFFNGISSTNLYRENTTRLMLERYIR